MMMFLAFICLSSTVCAVSVPKVSVLSGTGTLYLTETSQLTIRGTGFPLLSHSECFPLLRFNTNIVQGIDYMLNVKSNTELELTLLPSHGWSTSDVSTEGDMLQLLGINTQCDEAGWIELNTQVGTVVDDPKVNSLLTGDVQIYFSSQRVYQSVLNKNIEVKGKGFTNKMSFVFYPPLELDLDYSMVLVDSTHVTLSLKSGRKWRFAAGCLVIVSVTIDGKQYAPPEGISVAEVFADPHITTSTTVYQIHSNLVSITGSGFTYVEDMKITLRPTSSDAHKMLSVENNSIVLQLIPTFRWIPSYLDLNQSGECKSISLSDDGKSVALKVSSIDTGAGEVNFSTLVPNNMPIIGYITV